MKDEERERRILGALFVGVVKLVSEVVDGFLVTFAQTRLGRLMLHGHQLEVLLHLLHLVLATTTDLRLYSTCRQSSANLSATND